MATSRVASGVSVGMIDVIELGERYGPTRRNIGKGDGMGR